jgi:hypothetical protein
MRTYWLVTCITSPVCQLFLKPRGGWTKSPHDARRFASKAQVFEAMNKARQDNPVERISFCRFTVKTDPRKW